MIFNVLVCAIPFAPRLSEYFCRKLCGRREGTILRNSFIVGVENPAKYSAHCFLWHDCPFGGSCSSAFQFSNESSTGCVHLVQEEWVWRNLDHHLGWRDTNNSSSESRVLTQYPKTAFTRSDLALNTHSRGTGGSSERGKGNLFLPETHSTAITPRHQSSGLTAG